MFWGIACFEGGLGVLALALAWATNLPLSPVSPQSWITTALTTLPLCGFYLALDKLPGEGLREIRRFLNQVVRPLFANFSLLQVWVIAFLAGWGEELLFRGFLQTWLFAQGLSPVTAIGLGAIAFGLLHWITPSYALIATAMGAFFGAVVWWTGDLGAAIFAHGFYDGFALTLLLRKRPGKLNSPKPESSGELG